MADDTEVIRKQMEETRSHLAEKLEELENQVSETVQATTEAVTETVGTVKETVENVTATVQETFETVAETFNLKVQTERHPWLVVGASIAGGCLLAQLIPSQAATRGGESLVGERWAAREEPAPPSWQAAPSAAEPGGQSTLGRARSWFREEVNRLKGLALGSILGMVRDMAARGLGGPLGERVAEEIDHFTTAIGGETIRGPVLPTNR